MRFIQLIGLLLSIFFISISMQAQSSIITIGLETRYANSGNIITCQAHNFTATLENALKNIAEGGIINILDGTYHLDNTIRLNSKQSIIGQGSETNLLLKENIIAFEMLANDQTKAEDISIQHLKITIDNPRFNQYLFSLKSGNGNETYLQNNRISNLNIDYVNSVDQIKLIQLSSHKNAFIRDNHITDIELSFAKANYIGLISLMSKGKIKNNDFNNINLLKIGAFNDEMTSGIGIQISTGKPKASVLNNSFTNCRFPPVEKGIYISLGSPEQESNAEESWINNNRFTDLYFEGYKIGIDFNKSKELTLYSINHNMFRDIILQTKTYSEVAINNIFGKGNSFLYCHVYDWHKKNKSVGKHIMTVSKNARYTYINNPRIFVEFVEDYGKNTSWICNGTSSQHQQNTSISKTNQLHLYDNIDKAKPIKASKHIAKINASKNAQGNSLHFATLDGDQEFSKKLWIDELGNTIVKKQLSIKQLPEYNNGQLLITNNQKVGRIKTTKLKENLGITALENNINDIEQNQQKRHENLEERIVMLEKYIEALEQQTNEQ